MVQRPVNSLRKPLRRDRALRDGCANLSILMASAVACMSLLGCASASDGSTITPPSIGAGLPSTQPTPSTRLDSGISPRPFDAAVVPLDSVVAPQDMTLDDALAGERDEGLESEIDAVFDEGVFDNDTALPDIASPPSNTAPFEDLLNERVGFGAEATGGAGGQLCIVSSTDNDGPGTLRNCIEGAEGPTWVRFAIDGDIRLRTPVALPSHMTIDGREHYIRLFGHGFELHDVSNVIVTNIIFKEGNDGGDNDAIQIKHGAHDIWIHHVSLSNYGDGLIDITRAATDVTISWCKFSNHRKVMLIGSDPDQTDDRNIRVTLHHNWFKRTNSRHPRLRFGKVHAFNNYYDRWGGYAIGCSQDGECVSEANIFRADDDRTAITRRVGDDSRRGHVRSTNDRRYNGAEISEGGDVFSPADFYAYDVEDANDGLSDRIEDNAGWQR